jgi:hypothetical protein
MADNEHFVILISFFAQNGMFFTSFISESN